MYTLYIIIEIYVYLVGIFEEVFERYSLVLVTRDLGNVEGMRGGWSGYSASGLTCSCTVLYCHMWLAWLYHILPHYPINELIFGTKTNEQRMCI